MSANAINSVLWPHRATIPTMFHSPKIAYHRPPKTRGGSRPFMGAELYISRYLQRLLRVTKTAISGRFFSRKKPHLGARRLHRFRARAAARGDQHHWPVLMWVHARVRSRS